MTVPGTRNDDREPVFFGAAADLRRWLEANHETADELWVGLYKNPAAERIPPLTSPGRAKECA